MSSRYHVEEKIVLQASSNHNINTGENVSCSCYFLRFGSRLFSDRVKELVVYLVCMTLLCTSREDKTK